VVLDVIGDETLDRSAKLVRAGGVLVTVAEPPRVIPDHGRAIFFVVEPDRQCLVRLARRIRDGRLRPPTGNVRPLADAIAAFGPTHGKPVIEVVADDLARA
jgi:NADPH:quinone reductase-like Zn-dependent oxidoreductase